MSCAGIAVNAAVAVVRSPATSALRRRGESKSLASAAPFKKVRGAVALPAASSSSPASTSPSSSSTEEELPPQEWAREWRASLSTDALQVFLKETCARLAGVDARFICIGDGGILESVNPFPASPSFAELGAKGTCCTIASPEQTFEAHLFLAKVREVALARSERGGRKIYAVRFFGDSSGDAALAEGAPPPRPMLTVVLHGGEDGAVPEAAVEKWESLAEFLS